MKNLIGALVLVLGIAFAGPAFAAAPAEGTAIAQQCVGCHKTEVKTHGNHAYHGNCVSCHVTANGHAKAEEARENASGANKPQSIKAGAPESKQCLTCHEADKKRMHFAFAEHNKAGVQCSDCHGNHKPKILKLNVAQEKGGKTTALCASCHQDVLAKFSMTSHHPVKEGGATCTGCHDPHASKQATLSATSAQCTSCHQAVRGPHVFEHPPVVEGCTTCHDPHGSPNRRLQTIAQPMQCLQCHSIAGNRHGQTGAANNTDRISGSVLRDCASCHSAIHGSSTDQHLRF
ncbi:MAG: cytochrome c3 family protein [Gallionella sp.]|nr:cytochrome c3 family protein [Gallionella sp.]